MSGSSMSPPCIGITYDDMTGAVIAVGPIDVVMVKTHRISANLERVGSPEVAKRMVTLAFPENPVSVQILEDALVTEGGVKKLPETLKMLNLALTAPASPLAQ